MKSKHTKKPGESRLGKVIGVIAVLLAVTYIVLRVVNWFRFF